MKKRALFIATLSWEPRFLEGARRILRSEVFSDVLCFGFKDFEERTAAIQKTFEEEFADLHPRFKMLQLSPSNRTTGRRLAATEGSLWKQIFDTVSTEIEEIDTFTFDVTTTPREALWIILDLLTEAKLSGSLAYHRASSHGAWCAGEPESPHIVPKLGGISALDKPTKLLILTGFDEDRSKQFILHFEPKETLILLQEGSDHEAEKSRSLHEHQFAGRKGIRLETLDSYSSDWGFASLEKMAVPFAEDSNLMLASVGPKTSAVALYRLHRSLLNSALVYSPCREYNKGYSTGIGETLRLKWEGLP
jgi:hypothetical protein